MHWFPGQGFVSGCGVPRSQVGRALGRLRLERRRHRSVGSHVDADQEQVSWLWSTFCWCYGYSSKTNSPKVNWSKVDWRKVKNGPPKTFIRAMVQSLKSVHHLVLHLLDLVTGEERAHHHSRATLWSSMTRTNKFCRIDLPTNPTKISLLMRWFTVLTFYSCGNY